MAGRIPNYSLHKFGVNVDKNEIELEDGELREAQNAIPDGLGVIADGSIGKRPGLLPITPDLGDAVLGGIGVPFALRVSAINGTTLSNDPGPGGTPGSAPPIGGTPPPGGASGSGVVVDSGAANGSTGVPAIVSFWYRRETSDGTSGASGLGKGNWTSSDRFTSASGQSGSTANTPTTPAYYPENVRTKNLSVDAVNFSPGESFLTGVHEYLQAGAPSSVAVLNNKLYYSRETLGVPITSYVQGSLWVNDFATAHRNIATVGSETTQSNTILLSMLAANGQIYFTVSYIADFGGGIWGGAVYYYDPETGAYGKLGTNFTTETPYSLAWHSGQLWLGTYHRSEGTPGRIYRITPPKIKAEQDANQLTPIAWVLDHTMAEGTGVLSLCSFQGLLYAGSFTTSAQTVAVEVRSTLGVWSTSDSTAATEAHYSMGLIVFGGNLYYSIFGGTTGGALIRKFNGSAWSTVATVSARFTISWVVENTLMFGGGGNGFAVSLYSSPDGTTWTDRSANLSNNTGTSLAGGGVAVVQAY